jgi:heptose I phosphotransferase
MTAGLWSRWLRGTARTRQRHDWSRFVGPDFLRSIMSARLTDRFHAKQGRSTGRWVLRSGEESLVVYLKRHFRLPWRERVLALLWPGAGWSPAFREWENLAWAKSRDVPVPDPIAAGEFIGPGLQLQSFLAIAELTGKTAINELLPGLQSDLPPAGFIRWKELIIAEMARHTRTLHVADRYHKDLYLCHFYAKPPTALPCDTSVWLIDLHRLGHHPWFGRRWRIKDLAQLLFSTFDVPGITNRDRWRFFRAYCGKGALDRRLLRAVIAKADQYRRHNAARLPLPVPEPARPFRASPPRSLGAAP